MRNLVSLLLLMAALPLAAQTSEVDSLIDIHHVEIVGRRPMKQIGVQQTLLEKGLLKEHIALSMADVLNFGSNVYVKSHGRATQSTVAFRGTSPSHTQVLWNGMKINSPTLGMTDFSLIPSYFIDEASLLHGTSSVTETGGGLGGAVKLSTRPTQTEGFELQFVQGVGSFETFDEYLRLGYGNDRWQLSTRLVYATSPNEYKYVNRDKKENIYDQNG
ncbi:MAG: Plug domain-containing protein, partial [Alistipes sp.]|nr:Plug domain-containing protein [Alistipes sp.]